LFILYHLDPSQGEPVADVTDPANLQDLFAAQADARWKVAGTGSGERRRKLRRLLDALMARRGEAREALARDFRKPPEEVDVTELYPVVSEIREVLARLDGWMRPRRVGTPLAFLGTEARVLAEPKGRTLLISPWNYPLFLALGPLVSAIAAGNCCILKPSEFTPATSGFLASLLGDLFPREEVAVVEGDAEVARGLLDLPFDHVFFTGSPAVGRAVMAAASRHLASVTLELGGKSPVLVGAGADVEVAARRIAWGKFVNAGQTCVAPDYVLAEEAVHDRLVRALARAVEAAYGATPEARRASPDFARIISARHLERLRGLLASSGGNLVLGGESDPSENYLAPTLLTDVDPARPLMQEEIFGPVLPILRMPSLRTAAEFVNRRPKPLALYVFSGSRAAAEEVLRTTTSGGACINDTLLHFVHPRLPAGGVGPSGMGKAHGHHGFLAFSNERAVLRQRTRFSVAGLLRPPYTPRVRRLIDLSMRWF
jgi:aldehyde dehydrogenase (NAD+)